MNNEWRGINDFYLHKQENDGSSNAEAVSVEEEPTQSAD